MVNKKIDNIFKKWKYKIPKSKKLKFLKEIEEKIRKLFKGFKFFKKNHPNIDLQSLTETRGTTRNASDPHDSLKCLYNHV